MGIGRFFFREYCFIYYRQYNLLFVFWEIDIVPKKTVNTVSLEIETPMLALLAMPLEPIEGRFLAFAMAATCDIGLNALASTLELLDGAVGGFGARRGARAAP